MQVIRKQIGLLTAALVLIAGVAMAHAHPRRENIVIVPHVGFYHPYVYHPYWRAWPRYTYTYGYPVLPDSTIRTKIEPQDTEIFVDGYFAGNAREFDGGRRLHVTPGGHTITMYPDGYRTVTEDIWVEPSKTVTLKSDMERLARGEVSAPAPAPASELEPRS